MKSLKWRSGLLIFTILLSVYLLLPSLLKYQYGRSIPKIPKSGDPWYTHVLPSEIFKLGLDLMGGLHLVLGIDFDEVFRDATLKIKNELKELSDRDKISGLQFEVNQNREIVVRYASLDNWKKMDALISKDFGQMIDFVSENANTAILKMSTLYEVQVKARAVDQSLETLRNRIDEFGIAEPILQKQGEEKILIQFPGLHEVGRLKEIISRTAKLSFQIVKAGPEEPEGPPKESELKAFIAQFEKEKNIHLSPTVPMSQYLKDLNLYLQGKIPPETEVVFQKKVNVNTKEVVYNPYLLSRDKIVTGEDLEDASYNFDTQTNEPIVNFQLNPTGATKFEKGTGENVRKYMAIVLDGNVHSAPLIKTKIGGGRAMIEMGSMGRSQADILNDAKDTALVLRSGALPARLEFLEERDIGPSLGADAIRRGSESLAFGLIFVFVFMMVYYKGSGVIAVIALFLNGVFILALLASFQGTLTLPGLAGMTLTLGMAVDANVLIFEHMREELRNGKSVSMAISEGYSRAFSAILDGNLTTIFAGLVLLGFGYGPIRGFAVTMLMGLAVSMYTAVFATRVVFDFWVVSKNKSNISL